LLEWLHVQSWKRFVSEISNDFLSMLNEYQTPQPLIKPKPNEKWYSSKRVVGKNAIGDFMKTISKEAYLSKLYTNHSFRVTTISELFSQGFSVDQIQSVSGHKNPQSVQRYIRKRRAEDFQKSVMH